MCSAQILLSLGLTTHLFHLLAQGGTVTLDIPMSPLPSYDYCFTRSQTHGTVLSGHADLAGSFRLHNISA